MKDKDSSINNTSTVCKDQVRSNSENLEFFTSTMYTIYTEYLYGINGFKMTHKSPYFINSVYKLYHLADNNITN